MFDAIIGAGLRVLDGHGVIRSGHCTITSRPQQPMRIDRLVIAEPDSWLVHDVRIGNRNPFGGSMPMSGGIFFAASDVPAQANEDVSVDVEYIGEDPAGVPFRAVLIGQGREGRLVLSLSSRGPVSLSATETCLRLDGEVWRVSPWAPWAARADAEPVRNVRGHVVHLDRFEPRVVGLHEIEISDGSRMLIGVDDSSGGVVFQIGGGLPSRFDLNGYEIAWRPAVNGVAV